MDLNRKEVAELLSIKVTTLDRWIKEGNIPSYQIGGDIRFNRREIEDWVMQRHMVDGTPYSEGAQKGTLQFSLYRAIHKGGVLHDVPGTTKEEVIRAGVKAIADDLDLDADVLTEMLLDRESLQPTALGHGIGIPHTRDFLLNSHYDVVTIVFPKQELDYGALDGEPVNTLFFLFACDDKRHLNLLSKIAMFSSDPVLRRLLKSRPNRNELLEQVKSWEGNLQSNLALTV